MIEMKNVQTGYADGDRYFFPHLSFEEGRIVSVIGRNGCGKSTLLKTITGMLPYHGNITIDGEEVRLLKPKARARRVAYLPQSLRSVSIDVETLVAHGRYPWHGRERRMSEKDIEIIEKAIAMRKLQDIRYRNMKELSGGERQRAYLAMMICQDTPMILLDEPLTYMDMAMQETFYRVLRRLSESGRGIVMVSHNIEQTLSCSDRVCLVHDNTVKAVCTPDELVRQKELLREVFGAVFKKKNDPELLYPYTAAR
ncbi:MAG: ABC transporter ATP-binding protein [Lachnospiraceae bacterium]|nr:ABC transporter ATP-binding protein [Lachnospiraceae bacterium]